MVSVVLIDDVLLLVIYCCQTVPQERFELVIEVLLGMDLVND